MTIRKILDGEFKRVDKIKNIDSLVNSLTLHCKNNLLKRREAENLARFLIDLPLEITYNFLREIFSTKIGHKNRTMFYEFLYINEEKYNKYIDELAEFTAKKMGFDENFTKELFS